MLPVCVPYQKIWFEKSYHSLLTHKERLHLSNRCYICEQPLRDSVSLMTAFHLSHPECIYIPSLTRLVVEDFFESGKMLYMEDAIVEQLYDAVQKGLQRSSDFSPTNIEDLVPDP